MTIELYFQNVDPFHTFGNYERSKNAILVVVAGMVLHHDCFANIGYVAVVVIVYCIRARLPIFFCTGKNLGEVYLV
jgi:hypothetical protein